MNIDLDDGPAPAAAAPPQPVTHRGAWHVTWHGVRTVARLELRQRVRSTRWIVALVVWFVVVGAITLLATGALGALTGGGPSSGRGPILFAVVAYLVLGLGLLVTPTLTSTSVNGDRNAGTLATLQVTLLSPAEIVLGKVLAAWVAALAFLVASVPFFLLALGLGGTPVRAVFTVLLLVAALLAAVCGIGVGFSALTARTAGSTVLTFTAVFGITAILPVVFGLTYPSVEDQQTVQVWGVPGPGWGDTGCLWYQDDRTVYHTERSWWLLAVNPFVVVADGSTVPAERSSDAQVSPFASLREVVRTVRFGPQSAQYECWVDGSQPVPPEGATNPSTAPIWPWGLAFNVLLGAGGVVVAVSRLSIPQRTLPRGTRVA